MHNLGGLVEAVESGRSAVVRYADLVEEIAEEAVLVRRRQEDASADLMRALMPPKSSVLPKNVVLTPKEVQRQARQRQQAVESARGAVRAADQAMAELVDRRVAADAEAGGALGSVEIGDWVRSGRRVSLRG